MTIAGSSESASKTLSSKERAADGAARRINAPRFEKVGKNRVREGIYAKRITLETQRTLSP
jgi:hypothetical protein